MKELLIELNFLLTTFQHFNISTFNNISNANFDKYRKSKNNLDNDLPWEKNIKYAKLLSLFLMKIRIIIVKKHLYKSVPINNVQNPVL